METSVPIRPVGARHKLNMLVYSEPGVGKTPFIGTSRNALILEADGAETSLALAGSTADIVDIEDHTGLYDVLEYLKHERHNYKWVWLDGITLFQEKGLEDVMSDLVAIKKHRDIDLPDRGEYRTNYGRIMRWVRHMSAQPFNFGITAHVHYDEDHNLHVPLIAGKSASAGPMWMKVCGFMGVVGYLRKATNEKRGPHWVLHCDGSFKDYYGKSWFDDLKMMREPTVPKIDRIVKSAIEERAPKRTTTKKRRRTT